MLRLPDAWTWDFWLADDGRCYHLFFLKASRALGDPDRRHWHVTVGHATSSDLVSWEVVRDALTRSDAPAWDDLSTWTGSVVRADDGTWRMYYTGTSSVEGGLKQRVGLAVSNDLFTWTKHEGPVLEADPRWYEQLDAALASGWTDEAFRDPWVYRDPRGAGWHMLLTARVADQRVPGDDRGVIAHATSPDGLVWTPRPPLSEPGAGFGHLEVPQVEVVDGRCVLVFSSLPGELSAARRSTGVRSGTWAVPAVSLTGPFDPAAARPVTHDGLYSGRLVRDRSGQWVLLAFHHTGADGVFLGELSDPLPVGWLPDGSFGVLDPQWDQGDLAPSSVPVLRP